MKSMSVSARLSALAVLLALCFAPLCAWADGAALAEGADLRVMSYNIMHPDWSHVPVKERDEAVAAILTDHLPDVAALQEAGAKWQANAFGSCVCLMPGTVSWNGCSDLCFVFG